MKQPGSERERPARSRPQPPGEPGAAAAVRPRAAVGLRRQAQLGRTVCRRQLCGGVAVPTASPAGCRFLSRRDSDCQRPPLSLLRGDREAILRLSYPSLGVCSGHSDPKFPGPCLNGGWSTRVPVA